MTKIEILVVVLAFLLTNVIADDLRVEVFNDTESLQRPKIVSVTQVGELLEFIYDVGKRATNDRLVNSGVGSRDYEVFQTVSLEFRYPDASNQNAKITYVVIKFLTDSPFEAETIGHLTPDFFSLQITFERVKHIEYVVSLYAN
ncbi:unnamed protein product [Diamesa serratosioi]